MKTRFKTLKEWNDSEQVLTDFLTPCDEIDEDLYDHMAGVVFPQYLSRTLFQCGEAERTEKGITFYLSFQRVDERYFYLGILPEFKQPE